MSLKGNSLLNLLNTGDFYSVCGEITPVLYNLTLTLLSSPEADGCKLGTYQAEGCKNTFSISEADFYNSAKNESLRILYMLLLKYLVFNFIST
jgi:hypothetical protein